MYKLEEQKIENIFILNCYKYIFFVFFKILFKIGTLLKKILEEIKPPAEIVCFYFDDDIIIIIIIIIVIFTFDHYLIFHHCYCVC